MKYTRSLFVPDGGIGSTFRPGFAGRIKQIVMTKVSTSQQTGWVSVGPNTQAAAIELPAAQVLQGQAPEINNIAKCFFPDSTLAPCGPVKFDLDFPITENDVLQTCPGVLYWINFEIVS